MIPQSTFWDRTAARYARSPIRNMGAYEQTMARTRSYLNADDRVFEMGAGTSSTALLLAPLVRHYTSSDISAEMVAIGRDKARDAGIGNLDVVQAEVGGHRAETDPYDLVLAYNLLHLLPDPGAAARQAHAMLRPGGLFISKTTCLAGQLYLRPLIAAMQFFGKAPYVNFLGADTLEATVKDAGFDIIEADNHPAGKRNRFLVARKTQADRRIGL
ncbi:class I SAM-dependent methyltransferase [Rhodophyticola porphyridii]|uniref:Class I SAM-dependent methyltransferase n=1 Tax=Rhodophyticola porphyridii TaxID=1852017 RepID=A0A3L9YBA2_9RHOB|nr:class I SAM-dependent methyltransferase [Rhodophyticola porphyridii]RMA43246.1 class I SAM-dependent methyltransferase [Rhodophyticola porphyridii]